MVVLVGSRNKMRWKFETPAHTLTFILWCVNFCIAVILAGAAEGSARDRDRDDDNDDNFETLPMKVTRVTERFYVCINYAMHSPPLSQSKSTQFRINVSSIDETTDSLDSYRS